MNKRESERGKDEELNGQGGKRGAPASHGADGQVPLALQQHSRLVLIFLGRAHGCRLVASSPLITRHAAAATVLSEMECLL